MLAAIAVQDLIKIPENTKAALAKQKADGQKLGAPTTSVEIIKQVRRLRGEGASDQVIARALKTSPSAVANYLARQKLPLDKIKKALTLL